MTRKIWYILVLFVEVAGCLLAAPATAHEFWIDPDVSQIPARAGISADLRVGQDFSGGALPFLDTTVKSMTHWSADGAQLIDARLGDRPAIGGLQSKGRGLQSLSVETHPAYVVFETFAEFEDYLEVEGLGHIADSHRQRGLPDTNIAEAYIRNARALLQIGPVDSGQADYPTGLPFELVVQGNPFSNGIETLGVYLLWGGKPMEDAQISMFFVPDGGAAPENTVKSLFNTDAAGSAQILLSGPGKYLLNAVRLDPVEGPGSVKWQSHWASLTFEISGVE